MDDGSGPCAGAKQRASDRASAKRPGRQRNRSWSPPFSDLRENGELASAYNSDPPEVTVGSTPYSPGALQHQTTDHMGARTDRRYAVVSWHPNQNSRPAINLYRKPRPACWCFEPSVGKSAGERSGCKS